MEDEKFGVICLCAMRYSLGRQSYMPSLVQDFIRDHIAEIYSGTVEIMIRDIDEADKITEHRTQEGHILMFDGMGTVQGVFERKAEGEKRCQTGRK